MSDRRHPTPIPRRALRRNGALVAAAVLMLAVLVPLCAPAAGGDGPVTPDPDRRADPLAVPARPEAPDAPAGQRESREAYGAPVGRELRFTIDDDQRADLSGADGQPMAGAAGRHAVQVRGELRLRILARREAEILVAATFTPEGATAGDGDQASFVHAALHSLRRPFAARLAVDGRLLAVQPLADRGALAPAAARGLLAAVRVPLPAAGDAVRDSDATGRYEATVVRDGDQLHLCKLRYLTLGNSPAGEVPPHELVRSRWTATLDAEAGWPREVTHDEHLRLELAEVGADMHARGRGRATLLAFTDGAVPDGAELSWDGPWASADGADEAAALGAERLLAHWRARLSGETTATLSARIAAALAAEPVDGDALQAAIEELAWLLRLQPDAAADVARRMREQGADGASLAGALAAALAKAATAQAQGELGRLLLDGSLAPTTREATAVATAQVAGARGELLDALVGSVRAHGAGDGPGTATLLALGALAGRGDTRLSDGRSAIDALLALESRAAADGAAEVWLEALGNSGRPQVLAAAARYATADDENVRGGAARAVRKVDHPDAVRALARASSDPSPLVRARASSALARSPAAGAGDALLDAWRREREPAARRPWIDALARRGDRDRLAHVTAEETDPQLRAHAERLQRDLRRP